MELAWLEDFLALSSTLNFSRAAEIRNVTQPTFSRRIQNLELWVGAPLIDRSTFPAVLTEQGRRFRKVADEMVQGLYRERDLCKGVDRPRRALLSLAMVQTLAISFYPDWLREVEREIGSLRTRVSCTNLHDCVQTLASSTCDVMLCYAWPSGPSLLDPTQYPSLCVARELLLPVSAPTSTGQPVHGLDFAGGHPIPCLAYSNYASLATMVDSIVLSQTDAPTFDVVYESALAAALKAMAVAGHGVAWMPYLMVRQELERGELVQAGSNRWIGEIEIRAYRTRTTESQEIERLWAFLSGKEPAESGFTNRMGDVMPVPAHDPAAHAARPVKPFRPTSHGRRSRAKAGSSN
ncbi:MAG TPA: LysR substrate-binding domain-containing protein [Paraburkholderia sp.]|jgi:DNA-binding transcriptional LysR family regulator|nr:LysR substrate-binding domain-containing protein [Paraburkholderia sp.]